MKLSEIYNGLLNESDERFMELRRELHKHPKGSKGHMDIKAEMDRIKGGTDITEDPKFNAWFSGSKVVNSDGSPIVLYHGTSGEAGIDINANGFDLGKNKFGKAKGIHFMSNIIYAKPYNRGSLIKAFVRLKNPMDFKTNEEIRDKIIQDVAGKPSSEMDTMDWMLHTKEIGIRFRETAESLGYDGIYDPNQPEVVVLDPKDIWVIK